MEQHERHALRSVSGHRHRTAALIAAAAGGGIGAVIESGAWINGFSGAWARFFAYSLIALAAGYQLARKRRTDPVLIITGLALGLLSLLEATQLPAFDAGNTLALLILLWVVFVTTREKQSKTPLFVGSGLIAIYTVIVSIVEDHPTSQAVGRLLVGVPGQILAVWLIWRLIQSVSHAALVESHRTRVQEALATCSHALLAGRDRKPLSAALRALLNATEADYAYIDINRVDGAGRITWEIVADAIGRSVPPGPDSFDEGDYSDLPHIAGLLSTGQPARLQVSKLPQPIRARYEAEGIQAELMAPIMIRNKWAGTLGYTDYWRDDAWTEVEVDGLMRAADMVAAYWEREQTREGLVELAKSKDRFIATVSHELRTPLSAVVGFAGELANRLDTYTHDEIVEMVNLISSQSLEVAQLVDDLLTAERAAAGNLTIKPTIIDLLEETRSIVDALPAGVEVIIDGEGVGAWADTLRTRQIIRNLLTNAHRYGGTTVRVEISTRDLDALLVVTDNGNGVRSMDAEHIFDPYYGSQAEHTKPDSVGLGLSIARQLAQMMGGDLVYRRRDGWTRFELTLPTFPEHMPVLAA